MDTDMAFQPVWHTAASVTDGMEEGIRESGKHMERKITEIKALFQAAAVDELPELIEAYRADTRSGVQAVIAGAEKRQKAVQDEKKRLEGMKRYEYQYAQAGVICGIDEAGRGPLAGPVVAGAVILPKDCEILYLNDSKQLSEKKREELYEVIMEKAHAVGVGYASPERIDEINILQATYEAMREAVGALSLKPDILLNDAVTIPGLAIRQVPIIKGDAKSVSIAAASIIAKVTRDRLMRQYDSLFPEYGFAQNKGYGAASHIAALQKYGATPIHRRSFIGNFVALESEEGSE